MLKQVHDTFITTDGSEMATNKGNSSEVTAIMDEVATIKNELQYLAIEHTDFAIKSVLSRAHLVISVLESLIKEAGL